MRKAITCLTPWRNGSASDSRSEGCVFKSRRGQNFYFSVYISVIEPLEPGSNPQQKEVCREKLIFCEERLGIIGAISAKEFGLILLARLIAGSHSLARSHY